MPGGLHIRLCLTSPGKEHSYVEIISIVFLVNVLETDFYIL